MDSISITIGLPRTLHLIGCYHLNNTKVHKDHGGNALTVMKYFIRQQCVCATTAIHFLDIAGDVRMSCTEDICLCGECWSEEE